MTLHRRRALCAGIALLLGVAALPGPAGAQVLAKAGDIELDAAQVRALIDAAPAGARDAALADPRALEQLLRIELVRRLVLGEARGAGFDRQPATARQLERLREDALTRLWLADRATPPADFPSAEQAQAAYDQNPAAFRRPDEVRLAQIFIKAPDGADAAMLGAALRKAGALQAQLAGGDFGALARAQSEHAASAPQGGDLGFVAEDQLLPEVRSALRGLQVGETAGPIKTAQGLHFVRLLEKRAGVTPPLADILPAVVEAMRASRRRQLEQTYLDELTARARITLDQIELAKLQPTLTTAPAAGKQR